MHCRTKPHNSQLSKRNKLTQAHAWHVFDGGWPSDLDPCPRRNSRISGPTKIAGRLTQQSQGCCHGSTTTACLPIQSNHDTRMPSLVTPLSPRKKHHPLSKIALSSNGGPAMEFAAEIRASIIQINGRQQDDLCSSRVSSNGPSQGQKRATLELAEPQVSSIYSYKTPGWCLRNPVALKDFPCHVVRPTCSLVPRDPAGKLQGACE